MARSTTYGEASKDLLRTTVLRSIDDLLRTEPWSAVSMAKVAAVAGVSRQTLYNAFGTRDDLAQAYALWAAADFLAEVGRVVTTNAHDLEAALSAAFAFFLETAGEHPLFRALLATGGSEDLRSLVASPAGGPIIMTATQGLTDIISDTWPQIEPAPAAAVAEILVRLAISHVTVPTGTPADATAHLGMLLGPFLAQVAADAGLTT